MAEASEWRYPEGWQVWKTVVQSSAQMAALGLHSPFPESNAATSTLPVELVESVMSTPGEDAVIQEHATT